MGGFRGLSALRELSLRQMAQLQRIRVFLLFLCLDVAILWECIVL